MSIKLLRALIFCFLGLTFLIAGEIYAVEDRIVAVVNNEIITKSYMDNFINLLNIQTQTNNLTDSLGEDAEEIEKQVLERLIEDRLILQEAQRQGIEADEELINEKINGLRDSFNSVEMFNEYLSMQGFTIADLQQTIAEQIIMRNIVQREVKNKIFVHPKEVTDYFNEFAEQFRKPESVNLDSIFIGNQQSKKETKKQVKEAVKLLKEGKGFMEVAAGYSDIDSLGIVFRGQLMKEIEDVIFSLKVGEISNPVEIDTGYFIFVILEKISPSAKALKEVQSQIHQQIFEEKFQQRFVEWTDKLKEDAYIVIK